MSLYSSYFYNSLNEKYIYAFGSLFNNMYIKRNNKLIKVPLIFGPKHKYFERNKDQNIEKNVSITYPIMSYDLTGYSYNTEEKLNTVAQIRTTSPESILYTPIPYTLSFSLFVTVKDKTDGYQIIEQIIPFFVPQVSITLSNIMPGVNKDIDVVLNAINEEDSYEGEFLTTRTIVWTLDFVMNAFFFQPSIRGGESDGSGYPNNYIETIYNNYYLNLDSDQIIEQEIITI